MSDPEQADPFEGEELPEEEIDFDFDENPIAAMEERRYIELWRKKSGAPSDIHPISKGGSVTWKNHDDMVYYVGKDTGPREEPPEVDTTVPRYSKVLKDFDLNRLRKKPPPAITEFQEKYSESENTPTSLVKDLMVVIEESKEANIQLNIAKTIELSAQDAEIRHRNAEIEGLRIRIKKMEADHEKQLEETRVSGFHPLLPIPNVSLAQQSTVPATPYVPATYSQQTPSGAIQNAPVTSAQQPFVSAVPSDYSLAMQNIDILIDTRKRLRIRLVIMQAMVIFVRQNYHAAIKTCERALNIINVELTSNQEILTARALFWKGKAESRQEMFEEAEATFRKCRAISNTVEGEAWLEKDTLNKEIWLATGMKEDKYTAEHGPTESEYPPFV